MKKGTRVLNTISGNRGTISSLEPFIKSDRVNWVYGVRLDNGQYRQWCVVNVNAI